MGQCLVHDGCARVCAGGGEWVGPDLDQPMAQFQNPVATDEDIEGVVLTALPPGFQHGRSRHLVHLYRHCMYISNVALGRLISLNSLLVYSQIS
jgi:hypothetical protein